MTYKELNELKAEMNYRQNHYYIALQNYGESANRFDEQHPEEAHERIERIYRKYLDAKQKYLAALDEYIDSTPMTEYTSL